MNKEKSLDEFLNSDDQSVRIQLSRRKFLTQTGFGLGALTALNLPSFAREEDHNLIENFDLGLSTDQRFFRFAIIADTHIIDEFYKGPEGNALDTETILQTTPRLQSARNLINSLTPPIEKVILVGDYFHDYPSPDYDFYFKNRTRIDNAKALTDTFKMPVHVGFGNHDYAVPKVSREMSHRLFKEKLGLEPYYSIEHRGYKFIHLNNFIGDTWNPDSKDYNRAVGSLGEAQLNWFEAELRQHKPTYIFVHYPLYSMLETEVGDYGILSLLKRYKDTIQMTISGHWHRWFDFAHTYGAQHYVMGSTRYDEDAYMIVEVDTKRATQRILNLSLVDWATHYSQPYKES